MINRGDYGLARVHLVCEAISEGNLFLLFPHLSDGAELEVHPVPQPVQLVLLHLPPPARGGNTYTNQGTRQGQPIFGEFNERRKKDRGMERLTKNTWLSREKSGTHFKQEIFC
jgi:hypothetical protein